MNEPYTGIETRTIEQTLEIKFKDAIDRLDSAIIKTPLLLTKENIFEYVDRVTNTRLNDLNIYYDNKLKKINIYQESGWGTLQEDSGVARVVELLKSYYLNDYEFYLVKNINWCKSQVSGRVLMNDHLKILYHFFSIFLLSPFISSLRDRDILGYQIRDECEYVLRDKYLAIYRDEKEQIKDSERHQVKNKILKIIKTNSLQNITELNTAVMEILRCDVDYRNSFLEKFKLEQ